jgi:hypothetical protein
MKPDDPRWLWIVYGLLFVPCVGPLVLIVGSSIAFYTWRGRYPDAARRLNTHAWIAIGVNVVAHLVIARAWR